jgi:hypothetical protein
MKDPFVFPALAVTLALLACGSSSTGATAQGSAAGSAQGTVRGVALGVQDAFFSNEVATGTVLGVTSFPGACEAIYTNKHYPHGSAALSIQLVAYPSGGTAGPVTAPGTFTLLGTSLDGNSFGAAWTSVDASCNPTSVQATGGTIDLTEVTASQLEGTFDLTFGADHLTGSFTASNCAAAASAQGNPTCS